MKGDAASKPPTQLELFALLLFISSTYPALRLLAPLPTGHIKLPVDLHNQTRSRALSSFLIPQLIFKTNAFLHRLSWLSKSSQSHSSPLISRTFSSIHGTVTRHPPHHRRACDQKHLASPLLLDRAIDFITVLGFSLSTLVAGLDFDARHSIERPRSP